MRIGKPPLGLIDRYESSAVKSFHYSMRRRKWLSCSLFVLLGARLNAFDTMTLVEAIRLADQSHPLLQAGLAMGDAARAAITTAKAYPNPEAAIGAGRQTVRIPGNVAGLVTTYTVIQAAGAGEFAALAAPVRPALSRQHQFRARADASVGSDLCSPNLLPSAAPARRTDDRARESETGRRLAAAHPGPRGCGRSWTAGVSPVRRRSHGRLGR